MALAWQVYELTRIDASTNEIAQTFTKGGTVAADLAFLDGELWVLVFGDESVEGRMEVVRVDPATSEVRARIPLSSLWANTIVAAGGRVLVHDGGKMISIDPASNEVQAEARIPSRRWSSRVARRGVGVGPRGLRPFRPGDR